MIEDENDLSEIVDELDEAELKRKIRELEGKVTGRSQTRSKNQQKTSHRRIQTAKTHEAYRDAGCSGQNGEK